MTDRFAAPTRARDAQHSIVYRNEGEFAGWPFTSGFWTTADRHLVVGVKKRRVDYRNPRDVTHDETARIGPQIMTLRSRDQGRSWGEQRDLFDMGADQAALFARGPRDYAAEQKLDFTDRNVLVASGSTPDFFCRDGRAWIRVSTDGGLSWRPPILAPNVGLPILSGHGSALARQDGVSLIFLTAVSADGVKRRPVVYASVDGGAFWTFLSVMTPPIDDGAADGERHANFKFAAYRYFYPRGVVLQDGRIVASLRCQRDPTSVIWTEIFASDDGGRSWGFLSRVNDWGAPGDLALMADGRLACVYGYRLPPYGVRARISEDGGRRWGREIIIRDDGGSWDLGYPRVTEVEPGRLLTLYYMNLRDDPVQMNGGVRHIAQTVFTPD